MKQVIYLTVMREGNDFADVMRPCAFVHLDKLDEEERQRVSADIRMRLVDSILRITKGLAEPRDILVQLQLRIVQDGTISCEEGWTLDMMKSPDDEAERSRENIESWLQHLADAPVEHEADLIAQIDLGHQVNDIFTDISNN